MFVRIISFLAALSLIFSCAGCSAAENVSVGAVNTIPETGICDEASAAVLYCPDNKEVIYGHHIHEKRAIASVTKVMTAIIALEYAEKNDKIVTVTEKMYAEGSSMYLKAGDKLELSEIVKGMMAVSGNDAANAAALTVAGSQEDFAALMNKKAAELGMEDSHFVTPSGLDDEVHYSSAYDMALLCAYAMRNKTFRDIVSRKSIEIKYVSPKDKVQTLYNHNKLLSLCEGCTGIKTGYTQKAGRTLTSSCERDGAELIAVTLNDRNDWNDHCRMYDMGFEIIENIPLCGSSEIRVKMPVASDKDEYVTLVPDKIPEVTIYKEDENKIRTVVYAPKFVYAPVVKRRNYGTVSFTLDGKEIARCHLIPE